MNKAKKFISLVLLVVFAITLLPQITTAAAASGDWSSYTTTVTVGNITISTAAELAGFAAKVNSGSTYWGYTVTLSGNIDLSAHNWTPIGNGTNYFKGTFDGAGYSIENMSVVSGNLTYVGLFGNMDVGTIKNVSVGGSVDSSNSGGVSVGGLLGKCCSTTLTNCSSSVKVRAATTSAESVYVHSGGLVGLYSGGAASGTIIGCSASGTVSAEGADSSGNTCAGGLVGMLSGNTSYKHTVINSFATGAVTASGTAANVHVGGFVGYTSYATYTNCYSTGTVSDTTAQTNKNIGGFAGTAVLDTSISNSYALGAVASSGTTLDIYAGGFVGYLDGTANNCYSTGTITAVGGTVSNIGGFVGRMAAGTVANCYYPTAAYSTETGYGYNGGTLTSLTGLSTAQLQNNAEITTSYTTGSTSYLGQLIIDALNTAAAGIANAKSWAQANGANGSYPYISIYFPSLSYIETLKANAGSFYILEIVPAAGEGSIGYYIAGQEPCAGWALDAAKASYATNPATRTSKINSRFDTLEAAGILGTSDAYPLSEPSASTACYTESYPWMAHDGYTSLFLDHSETAYSVPGTFALSSNGTYIQSNSFNFISDGTGDYVQVIKYFSKEPNAQTGGKYYYTPVFDTVSSDNITALQSSGTAIYSYDSTSQVYNYFGTFGASDFPGMEVGTTYYYVKSLSEPSETQDSTSYVAVSAAYRAISTGENGYFTASSLKYAYVGTGGTYNFTYDAESSTTNTIEYNTVYYKYNYSNNNWFLKYVFDWSLGEPLPRLKVNSISAPNVTLTQVNQADLIVLSNGFVPDGTAEAYSPTVDISSAVSEAILDTVKKDDATDLVCNMPVIVDNRITNGSSYNLKALANTLKTTFSGTYGSTYSNYAYNNIFCFAPDDTRRDLATANLLTMYSQNSYSIQGSAFYPAYDTIVYENFLRKQQNPLAVTLEEKVNMARAVRYIINYAKQRVKGQKASLRVLDIEPCDTEDDNKLKPETVSAWTNNYYPPAKISITTMSTLELVGKIEDLIESYDLIYVGDNRGTSPSRNDAGLIYANIGKEVPIHSSAIGLTDAEYTSTVFATVNGKNYYQLKSAAQNSRYSGNDLSAKKLSDLNAYAVAGHPVVIAGSLINEPSDSVTFSVAITNNAQSLKTAVLTAKVTAASDSLPSLTPTYQWYKDCSAISGATGSSYTPASAGAYYCKASYTINGTSYTAASNTMTVDLKTAITNSNASRTTGSFNCSYYRASVSTLDLNTSHSTTSSKTSAYNADFTIAPSYYSTDYLSSCSYIRYTWYRQNYRAWSGAINGSAVQVASYDSYNPALTISANVPILSISSSSYFDRYYCTATAYFTDGSKSTLDAVSNTNYKVVYAGYNKIKITDSGGFGPKGGGASWEIDFDSTISPQAGIANEPQILTVSNDYLSNSYVTSACQWYNSSDLATPIGTGFTYSAASGGWLLGTTKTYICKVTLTCDTTGSSYSNSVKVTRILAVTADSSSGATSSTIPPQPVSINTSSGSTARVDNCSNMYTFLNGNKSRYNVVRANAVNSETLLRYINISKPSIELSFYPAVYTRNGSTASGLTADSEGNYTLEYHFTITNPTDPTPDDTRYYCYLYLDSDLDSRYSDSERVGGMVIHEGSDTGTIVDSGELKAGTEYFVKRVLSAEMSGFIPWKLAVVKVNEETVHASQTNFTYVKPSIPEEIDVLQINTGRTSSQPYGYGWSPRGGLSLDTTVSSVTQTADGAAEARNKILSLFDSISSDYTIKVQTITTTQINAIASTPLTNKLVQDSAGKYLTYSNVSSYLNSYDLVFIGFDDCYNELSNTSSAAIGDYLESGHPVFYSHDATSYTNVPQIYVEKASSSNFTSGAQGFFGYYFNKELRSLLGLDRYGITDNIYGLTSKSDPNVSTSGIVASQNYQSMSSASKQTLLEKDYSIAYAPGTNTSGDGGTPVGTTQGFTDYSFGSSHTYSTTITQVNKGQITTYPFDVNLTAFGGPAGESLNILQTHEQYYQVNMNPDNVVVWYCLDSSEYQKNDAANAYYLFTIANATYTGFGHRFKSPDGTTFSSATLENEAKLFVNSLIVAYRITSYKPDIEITDYRGENALSTVLLPTDGAVELNVGNTSDISRNIYFRVSDVNIGKNKLIQALISLVDDTSDYKSAANKLDIPIYDSQTGEAVTGNLISGTSYYLKLDEILSALKSKNKTIGDNGTSIYVVAKTSVHGSEYTGSSPITLRKLEMFPLS